MRVIAGKFGGRRLAAASSGTRPTTDRVREAVFSALDARGRLRERVVLDLFAGSGALGIEALSRGAAAAFFVEREKRCCRSLESCLKTLGAAESARVLCEDAFRICRGVRPAQLKTHLSELGLSTTGFDLIFADPPYDEPRTNELPQLLAAAGLVTAGATMVIESRQVWSNPAEDAAPAGVPLPRLENSREYGETVISYLLFEPPSPPDL